MVLVTGASMGIGREIALAFAREGAQLVLAARSKEKLEAVAQEINEVGSKALVISTDVTNPAQIQALFQIIQEKLGRLDVLVNNAGRGIYSLIENTDPQDFIDLFELNLFAFLRVTQKALPLLKQSENPKIINLSSVAGSITVPKMVAYCASKYAVNSLSEGLRIELEPYRIHVLNVCPGITDTDFSNNAKMVDSRPTSYVTRGRGTPARVVAEKIVRAAHRRKREILITFQNHGSVWVHFLFPRFMDWLLRKFVK